MVSKDFIVGKYLGTPYVHRGRDVKRDGGFDCWGLALLIYAELGLKLFDLENADYEKEWHKVEDTPNYMLENLWRDWLYVEEPKFMDGILLSTESLGTVPSTSGIANHCGIMLNKNEFIHACQIGTIVSKVSTYKDCIVGYYRHKELVNTEND